MTDTSVVKYDDLSPNQRRRIVEAAVKASSTSAALVDVVDLRVAVEEAIGVSLAVYHVTVDTARTAVNGQKALFGYPITDYRFIR